MIGTSLDGQGGVASVLRTWRDAGLFERAAVRHVATNASGGPVRKLLAALRAWLVCARLVLAGRVPLVHVHTSSFASFWRKTPFLALALTRRHRLIVSLHGGAFREFYAARGAVGRAWIRLVMRRAARFVVLTEEWRRWATSIEPRARLCVVPNTVPDVPPAPPAPHGAGERGCLLFLGRVEQAKGVFVLIEALARAHAAGACWHVVCAGTGDLARARAAAQHWALGDAAIEFVGWVDGDAKRVWLQRCEALVLPSLIENMPVAALEAFAHGKPVIASRVGGVPDMLADHREGYLVAPGSVDELAAALIEAWQACDDLHAMGRAARKRFLEHYACDRVVARVEALYAECIAEAQEEKRPS